MHQKYLLCVAFYCGEADFLQALRQDRLPNTAGCATCQAPTVTSLMTAGGLCRPQVLICERGNSNMVPTSSGITKMAATSISVLQGIPAAYHLLARLSMKSHWVWPRQLSSNASVLGLEARMLLDTPFKSKVLVYHSLLVLPNISSTSIQGQILWALELNYSCLENFMDRDAWWATVHGVTESWTWPNDACACVHTHTHTHTWFRTSRMGSQMWGLTPQGGSPLLWFSSYLRTPSVGSDKTTSLPLLLISLWFPLYSCRICSLLVFGAFSETAALKTIVL